MPEPTSPDPAATAPQTDDISAIGVNGTPAPLEIKDIMARLQSPSTNPVSRARMWVEMEIPENQRGPGWDRHWRELEAYAGSTGTWSNKEE